MWKTGWRHGEPSLGLFLFYHKINFCTIELAKVLAFKTF